MWERGGCPLRGSGAQSVGAWEVRMRHGKGAWWALQEWEQSEKVSNTGPPDVRSRGRHGVGCRRRVRVRRAAQLSGMAVGKGEVLHTAIL